MQSAGDSPSSSITKANDDHLFIAHRNGSPRNNRYGYHDAEFTDGCGGGVERFDVGWIGGAYEKLLPEFERTSGVKVTT